MSSNPVRLTAAPDRNNQETIDVLERRLREAKGGRIIGITAVVEYREGTYATEGSATLSRLQSAGALLEAAVSRLKSDD